MHFGCLLFLTFTLTAGARPEGSEKRQGPPLSAMPQTLVFGRHLVPLPHDAQIASGIVVEASVKSIRAALKTTRLQIKEGFACRQAFGTCWPLIKAQSQAPHRALETSPVMWTLTPVTQTDDDGYLWWVEPSSAATANICEQPADEMWPLFVDGTALVTRTTVLGSAHTLERPGPLGVVLRHAAGELLWDKSTARLMPTDGPVCRDFGPMPRPAPLEPRLQTTAIWHAATRQKRLALTFDACSTFSIGRFNPEVIAALEAHHVPATLFVGGHWAEMFPQELELLAQHPLFEIGNHTYSHPHMRDLPPSRQRQELLWTQQLIFSRTGIVPRYFRPPYGEVDDAMLTETAQAGLTTVEYDLPAGDADVHVSAPRLISWVTEHVSGGSVVIMHMNRPGNHTAEAIGEVARILRSQGYSFCRLADLMANNAEGCH